MKNSLITVQKKHWFESLRVNYNCTMANKLLNILKFIVNPSYNSKPKPKCICLNQT